MLRIYCYVVGLVCWKYRKDVEPMVVEDIVDVDNKMCCEPVVLPYLNEMAREQ